jgi:hypothetical protein
MKNWSRQARLGVIAAASFVLLITVLPQLASGLGLSALANRLESSATCSSSSGAAAPFSSSGSSSTCTPPSGALIGTVTISGAPKGFEPAYTGVGACPAETTTPGTQMCPDPTYDLTNNGNYFLSLAPGVWRVDAFYEDNAYGGAFLGKAVNVTIHSLKTITKDLTVPYSKPAALKGTITVTGAPARDQIDEYSILLCPSYAPYNGTSQSIACVNGYGVSPSSSIDSAPYNITGLPPGSWTAYPSYCTEYGCETNADAGKAVTLTAGATTTTNVTTPFITPGNGLLSATVTVTGAPTGFNGTTLLQACQGTDCQTYYGYGGTGGTEQLLLADGSYTINSFYLAQPYNNAVAGPSASVKIKGGRTTTISLSVPYQVPGTAAGSVIVAGVPPKVTVDSYTVLACPASAPWTPGSVPSIECASEYSGPGGYGYGAADRNEPKNAFAPAGTRPPEGFKGPAKTPDDVYQVSSLSPGKWILYPGYETDFATFVDPSGTTVSITANKTTNKLLTVPYQEPTDGAVTGTVTVIGAPANGFSSGAQACNAKPSDGLCQGEQEAYNESSDAYTLTLSPGTWWVAGFVEDNSGQSTSAYTKIAVTAGAESQADFTVTASS